MRTISRRGLPLAPLLHAYRAAGLPSIAELHRLPGLGGRFAAVLGASARFLYTDYLDGNAPAPADRRQLACGDLGVGGAHRCGGECVNSLPGGAW